MYLNMKFKISFKQINCVHEGWDNPTIWKYLKRFSPWDHYHRVHHKQDCM